MIFDGYGYQAGVIGEWHAWINTFLGVTNACAILALAWLMNRRPERDTPDPDEREGG